MDGTFSLEPRKAPLRCPFCRDALDGTVVVCECGAQFHRLCASEFGRCSTLECGLSIRHAPLATAGSIPPSRARSVPGFRLALTVVLALAAADVSLAISKLTPRARTPAATLQRRETAPPEPEQWTVHPTIFFPGAADEPEPDGEATDEATETSPHAQPRPWFAPPTAHPRTREREADKIICCKPSLRAGPPASRSGLRRGFDMQ